MRREMTEKIDRIPDTVLRVCGENPHYYEYGGKPVLLITSAEHYGAVINPDFDYAAYLDRLQEYGMNYTRIYPGAMVEVKGMFGRAEDPLAPPLGRAVLPWARSSEPGCLDGGNKFDLERWDEAYFARLHRFLDEARLRGIFVEICFFNCQYAECWDIIPFRYPNNIQGIGGYDMNDFQTLMHQDWYTHQKAYVREITRRVNEFGNVVLELCDEPTLKGTPSDLATRWISGLVDVIVETEAALPNRHLIAQQLETQVDFTADERVSVIVAQYIRQNEDRQIGGVEALDTEYDHEKPIELNETAFYPRWMEGDKLAGSRVESWEFMVGGGAAFNQLNGLYTVPNPAGEGPEIHVLLGALRNLRRFLEGFDYVRMRRDASFVLRGVPEGAFARCISEPGRQYALYLHHSRHEENHLCYCVTPGDYEVKLELNLPAGRYAFEWVRPETGETLFRFVLRHAGGPAALQSPRHAVDIALGIRSL